MKKAMMLFALCISAMWLAAQSPEWLWATSAGGTDNDCGNSIAIDSNGNSYVMGGFIGTATFGNTTLNSFGIYDIFIAKVDCNGNWLWVRQAGGAAYDWGNSIAADSSGNIYVTGYFSSAATIGNTPFISNGMNDIFVAKLDTNGTWQWARQAGGTSSDQGQWITTDNSGNIYMTGYFSGTATFGSTTLTSWGGYDIFSAKLDSNGNWLWAMQAGGSSSDKGIGIANDSNGNSYITGYFYDTATFGTTTVTSSGDDDIFMAKQDSDGNWQWAVQATGTLDQDVRSISTDSNGNSYVTGFFRDAITFGNTTLANNGNDDIFIAKLDTNGNFLWAKKAGGSGVDRANDIDTDSMGSCYVTGDFYSTATFGSISLTSSGTTDIFIAKLDTSGNWQWVMQAGGMGFEWGHGCGIDTDSIGNSYVTGYFNGTANFGTTNLYSIGVDDIFVAKLSYSTGVSDEYGVPQAQFSLGQNSPNPFTATTSFSLEVSDAKAEYEVSVYDLRGRKICTLHRGVLPVGERSFTWNGRDHIGNQLASGVYFYRVSSGMSSQVKKMIYVR